MQLVFATRALLAAALAVFRQLFAEVCGLKIGMFTRYVSQFASTVIDRVISGLTLLLVDRLGELFNLKSI